MSHLVRTLNSFVLNSVTQVVKNRHSQKIVKKKGQVAQIMQGFVL